MIVIQTVENGFVIHDEYPHPGSAMPGKTWVAPTIDELKTVISELALKERLRKEKAK